MNLNYNGIGDDGAKAIAKAIKKNTLTSINLGYNHIWSDGFLAIAEALEKTPG